uniref:Cmyb_C domain-containing protein n=1 Tax=Mesocestoides corti TaxID=53468 RepID=A0A5K3FCU4_MESCO
MTEKHNRVSIPGFLNTSVLTSSEPSTPEQRRGSILLEKSPCVLIRPGSDLEVKNSTVCNEKAAKGISELSALLRSKCISPINIDPDAESAAYSTSLLTYITDTDELSNMDDGAKIVYNSQGRLKFDFCTPPIQRPHLLPSQQMSAVRESSEPCTHTSDKPMLSEISNNASNILTLAEPRQRISRELESSFSRILDKPPLDDNFLVPQTEGLERSRSTTKTRAFSESNYHSPTSEIQHLIKRFRKVPHSCLSTPPEHWKTTPVADNQFNGSATPGFTSGPLSPPLFRLVSLSTEAASSRASPDCASLDVDMLEVKRDQLLISATTQTESTFETAEKGIQTSKQNAMPSRSHLHHDVEVDRLKRWIDELMTDGTPQPMEHFD